MSSFSAMQIVGPPKVFPKYGADIKGAWASKTFDKTQWINVRSYALINNRIFFISPI